MALMSIAQIALNLETKSGKTEPTLNFQKIACTGNNLYLLGIVPGNQDKSDYYIEKYNADNLSIVYQKNLNISVDDKDAFTRPLFTPPVCFEYKGNIVVFYNSFLEKDNTILINYKLVSPDGNVNPKFQTLLSSKDIDVVVNGMYLNFPKPAKPVINYSRSRDNSSIIIEVTATKYKKIFICKMEDLIAGRTTKQEVDVKNLFEKEKMTILDCFYENNTLLFSFYSKLNDKKVDLGMGEYDFGTSKFSFSKQDISGADVFSVDYSFQNDQSKVFISGYERVCINANKKISLDNSKVKMLTIWYNYKTHGFENKQEMDFVADIKKNISAYKIYDDIDKKITADNYLEKIEMLQSDNFIFHISQLYFRDEPSGGDITKLGGGGTGVTTFASDILINKFDRSGKFINQFLIPKYSKYNTLARSLSANLDYFCNKLRYFGYILIKDDLHFVFADNSKNVLTSASNYIPNDVIEAYPGTTGLAHVSLKNDVLKKDILIDNRSKCIFYVEDNMNCKNSIIVETEQKKGYEPGKIIID